MCHGGAKRHRNPHGERRPLPHPALHLDGTAQQLGKRFRDRQPQARSAVPPCGRAVDLLEGLEDRVQLVLGNPGARVGY